MFDGIAEKYDLLNALMSMGVDKQWRRYAVESVAGPTDGRYLDLAAGTLDISIKLQKQLPHASIISVDPSRQMLHQGRRKLQRQDLPRSPMLITATGEGLCLGESVLDGAIIAFGIRNFVERDIALAELHRVLKPGARLVVLELGAPEETMMGKIASVYINRIIPRVGALLSGAAAYRYLPQSMARFPSPVEFAREGEAAGFRVVQVRGFMFSVCNLYVFEKSDTINGEI